MPRSDFAPACALLALALAAPALATDRPIILDGQFDDWVGAPTAVLDPPDVHRGAIDIGRVAVADDPHFVHFFVELGRTVNLQRLDGTLNLVIDADGDASTGSTELGLDGVDLVITFSPIDPKAPQRPGMGVGVRRFVNGAWIPLSPYDMGVAFAPTAASNRAEIRIERRTPVASAGNTAAPLLAGDRFGARLVHLDATGATIDETDSFAYVFTTPFAQWSAPVAATDPLTRPAGTTLRVLSWNVERGAMFTNPAPFSRVLTALAPDVLLLQELAEDQTAEMIREWLGANVPSAGTPWQVLVGSGGGNLRTAVAARHPLHAIPELDRMLWTDDQRRPRDVRVAAAEVLMPGVAVAGAGGGARPDPVRTLFVSIHLKCCGGATTDEELTRLEEVQAIRHALRSIVHQGGGQGVGGGRFDAVVFGGDFNLVGSFEPLEQLVEDLDLDGTNMAIAVAPQLDGRAHATWSDPGQPFTPGQLDFVLFGNATLRQLGGFALDTRDLAPAWLESNGLQIGDTGASDHWPVVVDLGFRPVARDPKS